MGVLAGITPKGQGPAPNFPRYPPRPKGAAYTMDHVSLTRDPIPDQGDIRGPRQKVHPSDFYQQGKPFSDPGVHRNYFVNIRGVNAIAETRFGAVARKVVHLSQVGVKRSIPTHRNSPPANVETPPATTYGDMSTLSGYSPADVRILLKAI